ncbi:MAG: hypothetical protein NVSMB9_06280 [Isosphaeraceae bacterium]
MSVSTRHRKTRFLWMFLGWIWANGIADAQTLKTEPNRPDSGPTVVSKSKQKARTSQFLRSPGTNRYDRGDEDWSEIPPWRQASFFGIRARGQFFIYVVDCSGSMIEGDRLARAKEEVRQSVLRLQPPQKFKVIFYNDEPLPMPGTLPCPADLTSKGQLLAWLRLIEPDGGTDPRQSLSLALNFRPDAVFLLSDGEFPEKTAEDIAKRNPLKIPIHCVDLSGGLGGDQLKRIAHESGGHYASRPGRGE